MRIAICDDNPQELHRIESLLTAYRLEKKAGYSFASFSSAVYLLEEMRLGSFDVLLLDVLMPGLNGMEAAHEIRQQNKTVKIVFLSSSPEFALESYAVKAYHYLSKPALPEKLYPLLDELLLEEQREDDSITVRCKSGIARILFSRISYVEVLGKTLFFYMNDGGIYEVNAPLSEYGQTLLARPEFLQVHRAFLVNLWQMRALSPQNFTSLSGKTIPVSRRLYPQARDAYIKSLFSKKEEG